MRSGFGLVELTVALTIFSFGILGLVGAAAVAHRSFLTARALEDATAAAAMVIDSLAHVATPVAGVRHDLRSPVTWWTVSGAGTTRIDAEVQVRAGGRVRHLRFHAVQPAPPSR